MHCYRRLIICRSTTSAWMTPSFMPTGLLSPMPTFGAMMTKSQVLQKMHRQAQADSIMKVAMERGNAQELHDYARTLLREKKKEKAIEVFEYNYKRYPNTFTTNVGMSRGCAAMGKTKEAIRYANLALAQAPGQADKEAVEKHDPCTHGRAGYIAGS